LINKENIVTTYDEALQSIKNEPQAPRTINMISGPSRTADIEQTLTLGAHGPVEMIVVIYG
jgi:L-lactate dehydrogenase complex protein LldG